MNIWLKRKNLKPYILGVSDSELGSCISESIDIPCQSNEFVFELIRGVRLHFDSLIESQKPGDLEKAQLGLGHSYSSAKVMAIVDGDRRGSEVEDGEAGSGGVVVV
ncbi:hypothetical protein POM88_005143 [Heracleum sosnowskyi]|uniref:Uncharacterized protein n=1 Tax=Heracleum sosnowskyi TaxID=360622 RepID=A0AAD8JLM3_9APIA|nr:hypothetical protein POM88_005143 [Heracleum sosnowskyi]